jgi:flagellin
METSMERLASGRRINSAADDAAGSAIESRMTSQIRGLNMNIKNAQDGISIAQTMEGALIEVEAMAQRLRELAVQAASGTNSDDDVTYLQSEFDDVAAEMDRMINDTTFNGYTVWSDGTVTNSEALAAAGTGFRIYLDIDATTFIDVTHTAFDVTAVAAGDLSTQADSATAVGLADTLLDGIALARAELGGQMNTLEYSINNMQEQVLNTEAARARIVDTDFAKETSALSKTQILQQAGTAMLAQANAAPQSVLALLQ